MGNTAGCCEAGSLVVVTTPVASRCVRVLVERRNSGRFDGGRWLRNLATLFYRARLTLESSPGGVEYGSLIRPNLICREPKAATAASRARDSPGTRASAAREVAAAR